MATESIFHGQEVMKSRASALSIFEAVSSEQQDGLVPSEATAKWIRANAQI